MPSNQSLAVETGSWFTSSSQVENRPLSARNRPWSTSFGARHFGGGLQRATDTDVRRVAVTNWRRTCQSLQEKIHILRDEMEAVVADNDNLVRKCREHDQKKWESQQETLKLRIELEKMKAENAKLRGLLPEEGDSSDQLPAGRTLQPSHESLDRST